MSRKQNNRRLLPGCANSAAGVCREKRFAAVATTAGSKVAQETVGVNRTQGNRSEKRPGPGRTGNFFDDQTSDDAKPQEHHRNPRGDDSAFSLHDAVPTK